MPGANYIESMRLLARRLERDRAFFAFRLARQRERVGLTEEAQSLSLGVSTLGLARLAVCRLPRAECHDMDLDHLAWVCGVDIAVLRALLLETE